MLGSLFSIASLMVSTLMMMIGFGLMSYLLPVRALAEHWSTLTISVIATGYTVGFTLSCVVTPLFVKRVGHVRVFAALIALLTVSILLCALVVEWRAWVAFRAMSGFAIAGAYLIIESWLNERVTNENRGALFSVYMIACLVGSIGGQYLVPLGDPSTTQLFIVCGIIFCLAIFPTALSSAQSPAPIATARFDLLKLYRLSPIAFVGAFVAGNLAGAWNNLGGVYTQTIGMTTAEGATLLAAVLAGGALAQMPVGRISDRIDRRLVMALCGGAGVIACLGMALVNTEHLYTLYVTGFFVGTVLLPIYALNSAHANDRAEPHEYVTTASGIMILYGLGTVAGPLGGGAMMESFGPGGLLLFLAAGFLAYGGYAAWRMRQRTDSDDKTGFQSRPLPMQGADAVTSLTPSDSDATI